MKGFSDLVEELLTYEDEYFDIFQIDSFNIITVEPVPTILDTPVDLCNAEFLEAANRHTKYHCNKKRIEREGRG